VKICDKTFIRTQQFFVTPFSRFNSQLSGNIGGRFAQIVVSRCELDRACRVNLVTRMPCLHMLWFSRCWGVF